MNKGEVQFDVEGMLEGRRERVPSRYGPIHVTICGDISKTPCLTYHDVGLNHKSCFTSLIVCSSNTPLLLKNLCFYHIDAPGSEESGDGFLSEAMLPMTMDKLADQVEDVIQHFRLRNCLGMGVGAGGYVLTLHSIKYPRHLFGLILFSPACTQASWWEWFYGSGALFALKFPQTKKQAVSYLTQRLVSTQSSDLLHTIHSSISNISMSGISHYLNAILRRDDLTSLISSLQLARVLVMWGYNALYKHDSQELNRAFQDKERIAWIEVDGCGHLLMEECPFEVLNNIKHYFRTLQTFGYCLDFEGINS